LRAIVEWAQWRETVGGEVALTFKIPPTMKRIEMRLCEDQSGALYLQSGTTGVALCSLQGVLDLGWRIVTISPAERALLAGHGFKVSREPPL
jgi:hypothetical protein